MTVISIWALSACADRGGVSEVFTPPPDDRIFIFDQNDKAWDVSHAVNAYGMAAEEFQLGVGIDVHMPIVRAEFAKPGDGDFPPFNAPFQVIGFQEGGEARAYSTAVLWYHEVANDTKGQLRFAAVYSGFFEKTAIYERIVDGESLTLAFSGWGYEDSIVLYDLETESLWYSFEADSHLTCISGSYADRKLSQLPSVYTSWGDWTDRYSESLFLVNK